MGDINLHHPLWNLENDKAQDSGADTLIDTVSQARLKLMLLAGSIISPRAKTAIDLAQEINYVE